ncbi:hypothetical protein WN51_01606 [Melipona quadrifasciata]|uniref:Uncharacterized protein n=1 Tax=Melipona quadrifasciata TaxID=166423 RepID=A0A0M8ZX10_9HYME|nr:hypothetical protein WN51_01606 [Melipona quadrifasciata]
MQKMLINLLGFKMTKSLKVFVPVCRLGFGRTSSVSRYFVTMCCFGNVVDLKSEEVLRTDWYVKHETLVRLNKTVKSLDTILPTPRHESRTGGALKPTPGFRDIGGAEATKGANTKSQKEEMSGVGFLAAVKTFTPGGRRRRRCEKQQKVLELPPGYAMQPDVVPCWDAAPPITPPAAFLPPGYKKGFPAKENSFETVDSDWEISSFSFHKNLIQPEPTKLCLRTVDLFRFDYKLDKISIEFFPPFSATYVSNHRSLRTLQKRASPRVDKTFEYWNTWLNRLGYLCWSE